MLIQFIWDADIFSSCLFHLNRFQEIARYPHSEVRLPSKRNLLLWLLPWLLFFFFFSLVFWKWFLTKKRRKYITKRVCVYVVYPMRNNLTRYLFIWMWWKPRRRDMHMKMRPTPNTFTRIAIHKIFNANPNFIQIMGKKDVVQHIRGYYRDKRREIRIQLNSAVQSIQEYCMAQE